MTAWDSEKDTGASPGHMGQMPHGGQHSWP